MEKEAGGLNEVLSAGLCDKCSVPKMENNGDGVNEPQDPILWCDLKHIIVEPRLPDERIKKCKYFRP